MSCAAALDAADLTKSYAEEATPWACYEMLRPNPAKRADAASLSAAREASLVKAVEGVERG